MAEYIPSSAGQQDANGKAYYLRLSIERVYDVAAKKSTLTIVPQFTGGPNGVNHGIVSASLQINGDSVISMASGTSYGFRTAYGDWVPLKNLSSGTDYSSTYELSHAADGSATARFQLTFRTSDGSVNNSFSFDYTWNISEAVPGTVSIYADGAWGDYQPYVYDGSSWVEIEPYVYTASGWEKY